MANVWSVGISVSPCEEAARIGYDEWQINRIVIRMAQYFLDRNMRVIFGHDWREDGVMRAVADFAEVVAGRSGTAEERSSPLQSKDMKAGTGLRMLNVVPTERESLSRTALKAQRDSGGVVQVISIGEVPELLRKQTRAESESWWYRELQGWTGRGAELTSLRLCTTALLNPGCRICLGGKTSGYQGDEPGVMEEAKLALKYRKPLYLMGGFGGATRRVGEAREYWSTANGLSDAQKRELFDTTDVECAIRLIANGFERTEQQSRASGQSATGGELSSLEQGS